MLNVADIVAELDGNGFSQGDILDFSRELTQFTIMKDNLSSFLKVVYDDHELEEMLGTIKQPTRQQLILSNSLTSFSKREKQCYVMATLLKKSVSVRVLSNNTLKEHGRKSVFNRKLNCTLNI